MRIASWLTAFAICTILASPAASLAASAAMADGASISPAQVYGKLIAGQEKEVVSAAEAMPADKYAFAPTNGTFQGVRTFGQQVSHIAAAQYYFFGNFGIKTSVNSDAIEKLTSKDDIVKALKDSYAFAQQAIDTITAQNAFEPIGEHNNTRAGIAAMGLAHTNDHYGQMVVYLRMNGIIPPASRKP